MNDLSRFDEVQKPEHYNSASGMECIDAVRAMTSQPGFDGFVGLCLGSCLKYMWRWPMKGQVQSLKKAAWFLNKAIEYLEKQEAR